MATTKGSHKELDLLLRSAAADLVPSDALMARVMADADAVLAERRGGPVDAPAPRAPWGWLRGVIGAIGGWPAVAGLATATVAGIWVGYAQPGTISGVAAGVLATEPAYDLGDLMPGYDIVLAGG
jgi:hypothetical protein